MECTHDNFSVAGTHAIRPGIPTEGVTEFIPILMTICGFIGHRIYNLKFIILLPFRLLAKAVGEMLLYVGGDGLGRTAAGGVWDGSLV